LRYGHETDEDRVVGQLGQLSFASLRGRQIEYQP